MEDDGIRLLRIILDARVEAFKSWRYAQKLCFDNLEFNRLVLDIIVQFEHDRDFVRARNSVIAGLARMLDAIDNNANMQRLFVNK